MALRAWAWTATFGGGAPGSIATAALSAYAAGFVVMFLWTRLLHRRHGITDRRSALPAAAIGGAFGGLIALTLATADSYIG